jgi:hypothetical protein
MVACTSGTASRPDGLSTKPALARPSLLAFDRRRVYGWPKCPEWVAMMSRIPATAIALRGNREARPSVE